jgi:hypothetical protein
MMDAIGGIPTLKEAISTHVMLSASVKVSMDLPCFFALLCFLAIPGVRVVWEGTGTVGKSIFLKCKFGVKLPLYIGNFQPCMHIATTPRNISDMHPGMV